MVRPNKTRFDTCHDKVKGELKKISWNYLGIFSQHRKRGRLNPKTFGILSSNICMLNFYEVLKHVYNSGELSDQFDHLNVIKFWVSAIDWQKQDYLEIFPLS